MTLRSIFEKVPDYDYYFNENVREMTVTPKNASETVAKRCDATKCTFDDVWMAIKIERWETRGGPFANYLVDKTISATVNFKTVTVSKTKNGSLQLSTKDKMPKICKEEEPFEHVYKYGEYSDKMAFKFLVIHAFKNPSKVCFR